MTGSHWVFWHCPQHSNESLQKVQRLVWSRPARNWSACSTLFCFHAWPSFLPCLYCTDIEVLSRGTVRWTPYLLPQLGNTEDWYSAIFLSCASSMPFYSQRYYNQYSACRWLHNNLQPLGDIEYLRWSFFSFLYRSACIWQSQRSGFLSVLVFSSSMLCHPLQILFSCCLCFSSCSFSLFQNMSISLLTPCHATICIFYLPGPH